MKDARVLIGGIRDEPKETKRQYAIKDQTGPFSTFQRRDGAKAQLNYPADKGL